MVDAVPEDAPYEEEEPAEEELAEAAELDDKMMEAMALNAQLRQMVEQMETQEQPSQQKARPPQARRPAPAKSVTGAAMRAPREGPKGAGGWGGQTHTDGRANAIDRENAILVAKLSNIANQNRKPLVDTPVRHQKHSSTSINRNRKEAEIARENAKMAARLSSVKPTTGLSVKAANRHAADHNKHSRIASRCGNAPSASCNPSYAVQRQMALGPTSPIGALTGLHGLPQPGCGPRGAGSARQASANSSRGGSRNCPRPAVLQRREGGWQS